MSVTPTTITVTTTSSLMATTTWLKRLESFVPRISSAITSSAHSTAGRSTKPSAAEESWVGRVMPTLSSTFWR